MLKFIVGVLVGACLLAVTFYLFVREGGIWMGTTGGPLPMERFFAETALLASIGNSANQQSPVPADETNFLAGALVYQQKGCAGCHGVLDKPESGAGKSFYPPVPHLLPPSKGVTDDPVGATHWVVEHGIRFSGMPSFERKLSDTEIWQVSQLLRNADKLPASVQDALRQQEPP